MNFGQAVEIILDIEKGYVNDPNDPGGETNFGITKRSYPNLDIKNLLKEDAVQIYYEDYWDKLGLHLMPAPLRLVMFDCAVNQGCAAAVRAFQFSVNAKQTGGMITPDDLDRVNLYSAHDIVARFIEWRKERYWSNKNFGIYGKGWISRLLKVTVLSTQYSS